MRATLTCPLVEATVEAQPGEVVAVVGPNGAGKTSLLRALAGLLPATGTVELDGADVHPLPVHARGVGWVPQAGSLFAHLSAVDNVAYGLRVAGLRRAPARAQALSWLQRLGIADLAHRRPRDLSGGQAARVALARALAPQPRLILLDEPLASLDSETRDDVRRLLRATLSGGSAPALVVTHDVVDVVALADRVLVLEDGRLVQTGTPAEVTSAPRSPWVARLLGLNAWSGTSADGGLLVEGHLLGAAEPLPPGRPALALASPAAVTLHRLPPEGSARTVLTGPVGDLRSIGGRVRVVVRSSPEIVAEVTAAAATELALADGGQVWATVKATEVRLVAL